MKKLHGFGLDEIFQQAYLARLGASFEEFLADPMGTLKKYGQRDAIHIMQQGLRPLLPAQVRLRKELIATWAAEGSWGSTMAVYVEPRWRKFVRCCQSFVVRYLREIRARMSLGRGRTVVLRSDNAVPIRIRSCDESGCAR